jgi:hypothetical protein
MPEFIPSGLPKIVNEKGDEREFVSHLSIFTAPKQFERLIPVAFEVNISY